VLQEQRVAEEEEEEEEMKTEIAGKQRTDGERGENVQQPRRHLFDPLPGYGMKTPKVNYDNDQRRYSASNIPNFGMAWSVSGAPFFQRLHRAVNPILFHSSLTTLCTNDESLSFRHS